MATVQSSLSEIDDEQIAYRAVSRAAVASCILSLLGLLAFWFVPLMALPLAAILLAMAGRSAIHRYPDELTGKTLATVGLLAGISTLVAATATHLYIYNTEVPDGYERVSFSSLKSPYYGADIPPESAIELDGKQVFLKGYILPTSVASGSSTRFVLVPDIATCCFGSQPKGTHMVEVRLKEGAARFRLKQVKLAGTFHVTNQSHQLNSIETGFYQLDADIFRP
jgi:hypothetical protein